MKSILVITLLLAGCAGFSPDVEKSISRDKTMDSVSTKALLSEMIKSEDPVVRAKAAEVVDKLITPKKNIFGF